MRGPFSSKKKPPRGGSFRSVPSYYAIEVIATLKNGWR